MEVRLAETFLKVAELGNITKSAEVLGYSQSAITAQIKQLETTLGVQLFDRIGRGIQLTEAGQAFLPYAADLMRSSQIADAFCMDTTTVSGHISLIAGSSLTVAMLPELVIAFRREYPEISMDIHTIDSKETMIEALRQNKHDFVFDIGVRREYDGCVKGAERMEEFVFVCHRDDPLAKKKNVTLQEMFNDKKNNPFVFHEGDENEFSIKRLLAEKGMEMQYAIEFSAAAAIVQMLLAGCGRSMLPRFMVHQELKNGTLAAIDTKEEVHGLWSQLFYNANKWINPAMAAFIEFMNRKLSQMEREPYVG